MADGSERLKVLGIMMRTVDRFTPAIRAAQLALQGFQKVATVAFGAVRGAARLLTSTVGALLNPLNILKAAIVGFAGSRVVAFFRDTADEMDRLAESARGLGVSVEALHPEHIVLRSDGTTPLNVGDHFLLHSGQQDILVNRWDQYIAVRGGVVEAIWDIPARGCHH